MNLTKTCTNCSGKQKRRNEKTDGDIKLIGTMKGIGLMEEMISSISIDAGMTIVSKSDLLNNKGEDRKRKFISLEVNDKGVNSDESKGNM